jgi:rRNA maturation endonuclease Nob1
MTVKCPNCAKGINVLPNMKKTTCKSCGEPFDIPREEVKPAPAVPEHSQEETQSGADNRYKVW